jgi:predicted alpha/beta hydrolase family esterase
MDKPVLFIQGGGEGAYEIDELLAISLQDALGPSYEVHYPRLDNEADPEYAVWKTQFAGEIAALPDGILLVGHSVGGAQLLKYLAEEPVAKPISGLYMIAVPALEEAGWNYAELRLPADVATRLRSIPHIFFYHSRDDQVVPFAHLALHARQFPQATIREADGRGHQYANDLSDVARDIMARETV